MRPAILLGLALSAAVPPLAIAADPPVPTPWAAQPEELELTPADSLPVPPDVEAFVGGRGSMVGDPRRFPATFFATANGLQCTGTLVGPRVMMIAAHCVRDGGRVRLGQTGAGPAGSCNTMPGGYPGEISGDYAFCRLDAPVELPRYETMEFDPAALAARPELFAVGYGCTEPRTGAGAGGFHTGRLPLNTLPPEDSRYPNFAISDPNLSFICPGDSGGAVYLLRGSQDSRRATALASHYADQRPPNAAEGPIYSYLSVLSTPAARDFALDLLGRWGLPVCANGLPGLPAMPLGRCR